MNTGERRSMTRLSVVTAPAPGGVAILQLVGPEVGRLLGRLTGRDRPIAADQTARLAKLADVDEGLVVRWREDWAQIMPHGGPRVVSRIAAMLLDAGAAWSDPSPALDAFPEADDRFESEALAAVARAASPAAIDLLLAQAALWRQWVNQRGARSDDETRGQAAEVLARSDRLDRLIDPPTVVVVGEPNVGKSTLANQVVGRTLSVVADLPGSTRDWVAGLTQIEGVAVRWLDTPGLRRTDDPVERAAIELAAQAIGRADVVIALRDHERGWPDVAALPRPPDLWAVTKLDAPSSGEGEPADERIAARFPLPPGTAGQAMAISGLTGMGVDRLLSAVLVCLGLAGVSAAPAERWAFFPELRAALAAGDVGAIASWACQV